MPKRFPETAERKHQKLLSASAGDQVIIEFAQAAVLPGALDKHPWIARPHGDPLLPRGDQKPGLLDEMRTRGGQKLSRLSDNKLTDILKDWNFNSKALSDSRAWEAPLLPELRAAILAKYPAVEFDDRTEWRTGEFDRRSGNYDGADTVKANEMEARQAAVQEAVARQAAAGRPEIRDLAARQVAALEREKAAREAAEQEKAAREAAEREKAVRQLVAAKPAKATAPAPSESVEPAKH